MNLQLTKQVMRFIETLDAKQYKQVVSTILALLKQPLPHDSASLHGAKNGERRIDIGEYRVIYTYQDETISILLVGKRNDDNVYKLWKQSQ